MIPTTADAPILLDILDALRRRRKAFSHKDLTVIVERIIEEGPSGRVERLDLSLKLRKRQSITLVVRQDRMIWLHACESIAKAGWLFQYTAEGRFLGTLSGRDLIAGIKRTASAMFGMTGESVDRLALIWDRLLARGLRLV